MAHGKAYTPWQISLSDTTYICLHVGYKTCTLARGNIHYALSDICGAYKSRENSRQPYLQHVIVSSGPLPAYYTSHHGRSWWIIKNRCYDCKRRMATKAWYVFLLFVVPFRLLVYDIKCNTCMNYCILFGCMEFCCVGLINERSPLTFRISTSRQFNM